ncbi:hypothetical protein BG006_000231 [Podila minutissima]|uniref:PNPLA domain-containing protein n=1 Tax=Podila minutissima TaxID=64525 RepID=A0A9P5SPI6_9FUNG|nr:hypothetical protein BG006_000231 [Podila minutissima]
MATSTGITKFIHPHGARLLCLDGGGVRGIVSLMILDKIMKRVQERKGLTEVPRPADYFELAAGTSAGGITAIMLFRLHMTAEQAIEQYKSLSQEAFRPKVFGWSVPTFMEGFVSNIKFLLKTTRFESTTLDKAIDSVVEKYGLDPDDKAMKGKAPLYHPLASRMFACTVVKNRSEAALFRSYRKPTEQVEIITDFKPSLVDKVLLQGRDEISIGLTVKATSAAPTYFPEVVWKPKSVEQDLWETKGAENGLVFWDGGLLNNNPINQLWYARYDVVGPEEPEPPVSCVISLGTGYKNPGGQRPSLWLRLVNIATSVAAFVTNTDAKGKDFRRHVQDLNGRSEHRYTKYIRLNPNLKQYNIGLADYTKMGELEKLTKDYLQEEETQKWLEKAVEAICPPIVPAESRS